MTDRSSPPSPSTRAATCTRATPRQGTSYMAHRHEPLDPADPLLGFRPVPHKAPRRNSIVPARQRAFIAKLAETGIVSEAARWIGASLEALYKLRNKPGAEEFRAAWDAAIDRGVARLEAGALHRAIRGEERMVVSGGKVLGTEVRHNEALTMFFLRARRGDRYSPDWSVLKPGHPVYDRIADEAVRRHVEETQNSREMRDSLLQYIREMRARRFANEAVLAEARGEDGEES